ncbi:protein max-like [Pollicipes pollicipes]|uniref:protein max-like n=1 Tax=Pollicipes pollicipes TaxID=41117 RepID=UPI0018852BD1|nr:protein max-like [Pollicipes pollicipes]XP_037092705.1 protein max-like [Pollicipes pollicipes]
MSDEDGYNDIDSGDDGDDDLDLESGYGDGSSGQKNQMQFGSQAEKRAHHNALERKRRDHIKDSFCGLRDTVPALQGEKSSRAQILKKASDYIQFMRRKNSAHLQDIDDLRQQNSQLEEQIRALDQAREEGTLPTSLARPSFLPQPYEQGDSDSDEEAAGPAAGTARPAPRTKRIRRS